MVSFGVPVSLNSFSNIVTLVHFKTFILAKLIPLAYGIKKLQISCVVEDDKVSTEDLEEKIVAFEDYVRLSSSCLTSSIITSLIITLNL